MEQALTPEILIGAAGSLLSLGFTYIPGLREWYAAHDDVKKSLIMAGLLVLLVLLIIGSSCLNLWVMIACNQIGIMDFLKLLGIALVMNQSTFLLSPLPASVKAIKALKA